MSDKNITYFNGVPIHYVESLSQEPRMSNVYEAVAILEPKGDDEKAQLLQGQVPRLLIAKDEASARLQMLQLIAREKTMIDADRVSIFVRSFRSV